MSALAGLLGQRVARTRGRRAWWLLVAARPHQWTKNALVAAPAIAAAAFHRNESVDRVLFAFVAFCLLSSGTYLLNDVRDAARDRAHPRKRHRPVAAGRVSGRLAVATGLGSLGAGMLIAGLLDRAVLGWAIIYVGLTGVYTLRLRSVPWIEMLAVAAAYLVRTAAGAAAIDVPLSRWFLLVVTAAALAVVAGKRDGELRRAGRSAVATRAVLGAYRSRVLSAIWAGALAAAFVAYAGWAVSRGQVAGAHESIALLSCVPLGLALWRTARVFAVGGGEEPEMLLMRDRLLLLAALVWIAIFVFGVGLR